MGHKDISLSSKKESDFLKSIVEINKFEVDTILISPLLRAKQTLEIISKRIKFKDVIEDYRLIERNFGCFEGQKKTSSNRVLLNTDKSVENIDLFRDRILDFFKSYEDSNKSFLIIGHSAFYREAVELLQLNNNKSINCCETIQLKF